MTTLTSTYAGPAKFHGDLTDTDSLHYPEVNRLNAALTTSVQTAVTALDLRDSTLQSSFTQRVPLTLTANSTWATYAAVPTACTVTAIKVITPTAWASAGGTVLLTVKKTSSGGNTMLVAATYDLEVPSANALTALSLTATGADLGLAADGLVYIAVVSNNADATGPAAAAGALLITYTPTIV